MHAPQYSEILMTTYKPLGIRSRGRQSTHVRLVTLASLFVAIALQLNARVAIAAGQLVQPVTLDIPAGTRLEDALIEWGRQARMTIMIDTRSIAGLQASKMHGTFNTDEALKILLRDSGLTYTKEGQIVHIVQTNRTVRFEKGDTESAEIPSGSSDFNLPVSLSGENESDSISGANSSHLDEVLVTADKTGVAERLKDVPAPISVISAQALMDSNQSRLEDYFDQIPGLMLAQGQLASVTSIRGITTGENTNPTVGFTLDDVPLGASTNGGAVGQVPIVNPADLAQVEVLRGPQGTIYGDNSMGGLIRYVTVDPSTDRVFGDIRVGGSGVVNGAHLGYNTSAAVNVPLTDTLAIRVSAFTQLDPGYIDNVETGERSVNATKTGGGRISAKWAPSEDFSLKFSALYEKTDLYGASSIDVPTIGYPNTLGLGDLQQYYYPGVGIYDQEWKNASLTLNATVRGVKLTAITGYTFNEFAAEQDFTYAGVAPPPPPVLVTPIQTQNQAHKFSQEIRLTDTLGSHFEWLLGGFYTQEDTSLTQFVSAANPTTGAIVGEPGSIYWSSGPGRFKETAGFGALTLKATDRFDVQFGARESYLATPSLTQGNYSGGSLNNEPSGPSTFIPPSSSYWKANAFTYLVSPRFKLTPDVMIYSRVADGFRPGSGTSNPAPNERCVTQDEPCQINPDKITNYEVGIKADFFNHRLSVDSSLYYIDWKDLQVELLHTSGNYKGIKYAANGSGAKSQGADLSLSWKPLKGLTISTWGDWDQAVLTQPFLQATAGQPLPYSARFTGNFSVQEDIPISGNMLAFFGGKEIYTGDRLGEFTAQYAPRQDLPAYSQTDFNAGIRSDPWTLNLYVNNATDRRGLLYGGLGSPSAPYEFNYINPRTIGLSVERTF